MASTRSPAGPVRVLTMARQPEAGRCALVDDGKPCTRPVASRGLCGAHARYLRKVGRFEEFALPRRTYRRRNIEVKPEPEAGICRVVVDGTPCTAKAQGRGLCRRHYASIWQRDDLDLADFCLAPLTERIQIKRDIRRGTCRIHEAGTDCEEPAKARGLCRRHYNWLATKPELFERFARPQQQAIHYSRRSRVRKGRCRAAENSQGCPKPAVIRGLCKHHLDVLRKDPALMAKIALPARKVVQQVFARVSDDEVRPDRCVVVENDEPCLSPSFQRGVCQRHHTILGSHADYSLHDFNTAAPPIELSPKSLDDRTDGLCIIVENGIACERSPHVRGLCRRHYRWAAKAERLEELALPARHRRDAPHGAANPIPHGFLDKNVLFDHADYVIFGTGGQQGSVALVERTRGGAFRASVSVDAVKTTYNHVRHRLQRPTQEGGGAISEAEAEERASTYVRETFFKGGAWRLIALAPLDIARVVLQDDRSLSLEDALELRAYEMTCEGKAAPRWFVTRDTDFPEGVHPWHLARELGWC